MTTQLRPFEDLIQEIEYEGERLIPIQKIAALAFNYNLDAVKKDHKKWVNDEGDARAWYLFETDILKPEKHECLIGVSRSFDIWKYIRTSGGDSGFDRATFPPSNQMEIFRCLVKWGFVSL